MMEKAKKTKIIIGLSYLVLLTIFVLLFFSKFSICLLYTSPSPRDYAASRMPSSA